MKETEKLNITKSLQLFEEALIKTRREIIDLQKRIAALRSRKNSSHRVTQGMLTESHTAVFRCELCEKLCETLWETLSLTANASHIKRTGCKTVNCDLLQHLRVLVTPA